MSSKPQAEATGFAVDGTIINFSSVDFGGTLPQLSWGKWVQQPTFPIKASSQQHFVCCGRELSPSGVVGMIIFTAKGGTVELSVACPFSGSNEFKVTKNDIPGINAVVTYYSGDRGHPTIGTIEFKNK